MLKPVILLVVGFIILFALFTGYRLLRLSMNVVSYRKFWAKEALASPAVDDFVYVALGDSAAQGIGASKPLKGYVGLVAAHVEEKTGRNVRIINLSVSGAKLKEVLDKQLPQLNLIPRIDLITIEAGVNDVPSFDETKFTADFDELVGKLPPGTVISDIPSFRGGIKGSLSDTSLTAANIATIAIGSRSDLHITHLFNATNSQGFKDFAADLFHPSDKGYQNWSKAFIDAIDEAHLL